MRNHSQSGLLYALGGFALLSVGDAVVKTMTGDWPPTAIAALRYTLGAVGLSAILLASEGMSGFRFANLPLQIVRGIAVAISTVAFFGSLFVMPLAEATTIVFVNPLITALLAPIFLREKAPPTVWLASGVAFVGVLIVLRPNLVELGPPALLPLASALGMSALFMANRAVAGSASALAMQAQLAIVAAPILLAIAMIAHLSGFEPLSVGIPSATVIAKCVFVALSASTAHWLIYMGTTRAGAATIAPMTYVQIIAAIGLGWLWFGDMPDLVALVGTIIIIGAGLYLWHSGRPRISLVDIDI